MSVNLDALASQSAAQGNQMLNDDQTKAASYKDQYGTYQGQADAANKNVSDYNDYMKGEGSAGNQYHAEQSKELGELGYDPAQMTAARGNLNQATGALSAYSDFANTAASKWGMNAGGFAAANAGALGSLNNNIASNQGVVNGLSDLYKTSQTGANQFTGNVIQGEQTTLSGLQDVFTNAANQRDSAGAMMQFYDDLAQKQGGLNAQQQQYYGLAKQAYAGAQAAMAQASLYGAQAAQTRQQIQQGSDYMNSPAYQNYLKTGQVGSPTTGPSTPVANGGIPGNPASFGQHVQNGLADAALGVGHAAGAVGSGTGSLLGKVFR